MKTPGVTWIWMCVLAAMLFISGRLRDAGQWNWINLRLIKGQDASISVATPDCAHIWLASMAIGQRSDRFVQRQAFLQVLGCSPNYLSLVQAVLPEDQELARLATQYYPENSKAWFWLGETLAPTDQLAARQAYLQTVKLAPRNGLAWCRLGHSYENTGELEKAANAFLNCCLNGDPGYHGCDGAGRMMEKLGNLPQAIAYYRLSHWEMALNRADELERQLIP